MPERSPEFLAEAAGTGTVVNLSLISHTNVGKTTLARTLLGRDIGEVRDAAHVTELASGYVLVQAGEDTLMLWDTPGFGDTARLLKRLRLAGNPLGWLLSQVWDRWRERPLWASQQAVRNAREQADVILYLVNAGEDPAAAAYVPLEMEVLSWIGKPVVLLLNQMGPPRAGAAEEIERWRQAVEGTVNLAGVLPLDAFARCWVQEGILLETIAPLLPDEKRLAMSGLIARWSELNRARFEASMAVLARALADAATDQEAVGDASWHRRLGEMLSPKGRERPEVREAMGKLAERLEASNRASTDALIRLHNLSGKASHRILERVAQHYSHREKTPEGAAAALGGLVSGAATGLAADLAAGGLTLGGGLIVGAIIGALGAGGLARGVNMATGADGASVRWSEAFFTEIIGAAILRYLAVAHFGRGRGNWEEGEYPAFWLDMVRRELEDSQPEIGRIYTSGKDTPAAELNVPLQALLSTVTSRVLSRLYPSAGAAQI